MTNAIAKIDFQPVRFVDLPYWAQDDHVAAFGAFVRSCPAVIDQCAQSDIPPPGWHLNGEPARDMEDFATTAAAPRRSLRRALKATCQAAMQMQHKAQDSNAKLTGGQARAFFETFFTPHQIAPRHKSGLGPGLLTGYYEPVLKGSRRREGLFQTPLYTRPNDLVNLVEEQSRAGVGQEHSHARQTETGLEPFATRAQIESGALAGGELELLYLPCPVDAFFLHIQGSGLIELDDGTSVRLTYDGKNGWPYSSIGKLLIDQGVIGADTMSLQALGEYLRADLGRAEAIMQYNKSFVFFRELHGEEAAGAHGVMNVQLTPGRSLAIDPRFHMMGAPVYVCAPDLHYSDGDANDDDDGDGGDDCGRGRGRADTGTAADGGFYRLMIGQDVGSAIKGAERGDIYFGSGAGAGELAGVTKQAGKFFVLLPALKPEPLSNGV